MKKLFTSILALVVAASALFAQSTEEILSRMEQERARFDKEGSVWVLEMKLPIVGTLGTRVTTLGDKYRMDFLSPEKPSVAWSDGVTDWDYDPKENTVTISNHKSSEDSDKNDDEMLDGIADGYDLKLKKETDEAWYFRCTRSKSNPKKDDPKNMDLVVSKSTYLPISISAKKSLVTVTLRDFAVGVSEADVTFDPAKYPNAKIVDKR